MPVRCTSPSKMMHKETLNMSVRRRTRHWLRDSLTLLAEALVWGGCACSAEPLLGLKAEDVSLYAPFIPVGWGIIFLVVASFFVPNNTYSRTSRRDEVVAKALKTALCVSVLFLAAFSERTNIQWLTCLLFCIALPIGRLILNSFFIRYSIRHSEQGILVCNEETVWQQQALQQNTYGLKLARLEEQTAQRLAEYLSAHPKTESVYCVPSALPMAELESIARICREKGLLLHLLPQPIYALNKDMKSECRGTVNVLSPVRPPLKNFSQRMVKRLTDIVLSLVILLTVFPVVTLVAFICIKRQSRGPVLVARHMCGMNGKTFLCLTFRTRHYEAAPSFFDGAGDPGYFPFGKFLAHSRLELLPQFLCVLWGSMTIVGSQMMRPEHYADYRQELKQLFATSYRLKAGITSHHFATAKSSTTADVWYYRNWGFWLDLRIMLQRIGTLLSNSKTKAINYI